MPAGGPDLRIEPLQRHHDRVAFRCGVESLDQYLRTQASQDIRRRANAVFVLTSIREATGIRGYHTLCAYTLSQGDVPEAARKHIPRYPLVSATLIRCLAVAREHQGRGYGALLLVHALRKAHESAVIVGSSMVVVDALDDGAARFYEAHGLTRLPDSLRLVIPMRSIAAIAKSSS